MGRFGQHYKVNVGYTQNIEEGDYSCIIKSAIERESKSGKPMAVMDLAIEGHGLIKYYLVDDRSDPVMSTKSDIRITRFFDCFDIKRGLFNFNMWVGKKGLVHIGKGKPDGQGYIYLEVKKLYTKEEAKMILAGPEDVDIIQDDYNSNVENIDNIENMTMSEEEEAKELKELEKSLDEIF